MATNRSSKGSKPISQRKQKASTVGSKNYPFKRGHRTGSSANRNQK